MGGLRHQRAFTLLEVLIIVSIIGVLFAVGLPGYERHRQNTMNSLAVSDIKQIEAKLDKFFVLNYRYPESLAEVGGNIKDPWGMTYQYVRLSDFDENGNPIEKGKESAGSKAKVRKDRNLHPINTDYDLYSMGADGRSVAPLTAKQSRDDIIRASNGAFVGVAENY